jgi:hypothetical protein
MELAIGSAPTFVWLPDPVTIPNHELRTIGYQERHNQASAN